jgi:hypothetical protein
VGSEQSLLFGLFLFLGGSFVMLRSRLRSSDEREANRMIRKALLPWNPVPDSFYETFEVVGSIAFAVAGGALLVAWAL